MSKSVQRLLSTGVELLGELRIRAARTEDLIDLAAEHPADCDEGYLVRDVAGAAAGEAAIQLVEDVEYEYELVSTREVLELQPREVWDGLDPIPLRGRLKPKRWLGTIRLEVRFETETASVPVEVRARKMGYRTHFRWMLDGISNRLVDLVMRAFSPSELAAMTPSADNIDAETLYQRFASMAARLGRDDVVAALEQIERSPDRRYRERFEPRPPGRGRTTSQLGKDLARCTRTSSVITVGEMKVPLPRSIPSRWFDEDLDTPANRFARFMIEDWRGTAVAVRDALSRGGVELADSAKRGIVEATDIIAQLDQRLAGSTLSQAGKLGLLQIPHQAVQNRSGYRELYSHWLQSHIASELSWIAPERISVGARDVALLYETWCFLELLAAIERVTDADPDATSLVGPSRNGVEVDLKHGCHLSVRTSRFGTELKIALHYNRTHTDTSWTLPMRPDITLVVTPTENTDSAVVVHFDAKYRIDRIDWSAAELDETKESSSSTEPGRAKRDDLVKMHAYRDAIRRSVGSYVLYPGRSDTRYSRYELYDELVPGVGAFALRPSSDGKADADDSARIDDFLRDLLIHVCDRVSKRYRADFWHRRAYGGGGATASIADILRRPPADVRVLLAYVRSAEYLRWIAESGRYLIRADRGRRGAVGADSDVLAPDLIVFYRGQAALGLAVPTGTVEVTTSARLRDLGYPHVGDSFERTYFSLAVELGSSSLPLEGLARVAAGVLPVGSPHCVKLSELI